MTRQPTFLRGLLMLFTGGLYAVSFFLPAWNDGGTIHGYDAFVLGAIYFFLVPFSIPWYANIFFVAAWICLACKNDIAAKVLGIVATLLAGSYVIIWQPWRGSGVDWGYILWSFAMVSVGAAGYCLQVVSAHYEEMDRRVLLAEQQRWLRDFDESADLPSVASGETSKSIRSAD